MTAKPYDQMSDEELIRVLTELPKPDQYKETIELWGQRKAELLSRLTKMREALQKISRECMASEDHYFTVINVGNIAKSALSQWPDGKEES